MLLILVHIFDFYFSLIGDKLFIVGCDLGQGSAPPSKREKKEER